MCLARCCLRQDLVGLDNAYCHRCGIFTENISPRFVFSEEMPFIYRFVSLGARPSSQAAREGEEPDDRVTDHHNTAQSVTRMW